MIIGIVVLAGFIIYSIVQLKTDCWYDFGDAVFNFVVGIVVCAMVTLVGGLIIGAIFSGTPTLEYTKPLVSLQDTVGSEGRFFLGSGVINDKPGYVYYIKRDDGTFVLESKNARDVRIKESNETPSLSYYGCSGQGNLMFNIFPSCDSYFVFTVPNNSIKYNFNLDARK